MHLRPLHYELFIPERNHDHQRQHVRFLTSTTQHWLQDQYGVVFPHISQPPDVWFIQR